NGSERSTVICALIGVSRTADPIGTTSGATGASICKGLLTDRETTHAMPRSAGASAPMITADIRPFGHFRCVLIDPPTTLRALSGVSGLVEASAVRISPLASALEFGVQLGFGHGLACIHVNLYPVIREAVEDGVSILVEVFCSGFDRGRLVLVGKLDPDAVLGDT